MEGPFYIKRGTDFVQVPVIVTCCFQAGMLILEEKRADGGRKVLGCFFFSLKVFHNGRE